MSNYAKKRQVRDYVQSLIQSSAQFALVIDQMDTFARRQSAPRTRPVSEVLSELVEGILLDPEVGLDLDSIDRSSQLLVAVTEAIGRNLFFVDPDSMDDLRDLDFGSAA